MTTRRLTMAQALVEFLAQQWSERDGVERRLVPATLGIFGHGNVAGVGEALRTAGDRMRFLLPRNEQAMVHTAAGYAKMANRLQTLACTSSVGPGATNMITGAAGATINRLPVLLLPGDVFATRQVAPVLQQLEHPASQDVSVNDAFRPVSRYFDRIQRPEQLVGAALEAMRTLTSPAEAGAVTLALPEDVQCEAWDYPEPFFRKRVWRVPRARPEPEAVAEAAAWIRAAKRPLIVAGGGVQYSEAEGALRALVEAAGIPVAETQAGKGALRYDHPSSLGAIGVTGTPGANALACEADLVIGVGTRWSDFTTASKTAFQDPGVRFVNLNVAAPDAAKHAGLALIGDARAGLEALAAALAGHAAPLEWRERAARLNREWDAEVTRLYAQGHAGLPSQAEVIGAVNDAAEPRGVVVCAAGSLPGDLHKLWRARDPKDYQIEYGYSCMGYEVAGGLGAKLAAPDREVFVMVGDGSWLMMSGELVTAVEQGVKLIVVLVDNSGFASIGGLSESLGSGGFGTRYSQAVDFEQNARSLGAVAVRASGADELRAALAAARREPRTSVIVVRTDRASRVPGYGSWWDVPPAAVSSEPAVQAARAAYEAARLRQRWLV